MSDQPWVQTVTGPSFKYPLKCTPQQRRQLHTQFGCFLMGAQPNPILQGEQDSSSSWGKRSSRSGTLHCTQSRRGCRGKADVEITSHRSCRCTTPGVAHLLQVEEKALGMDAPRLLGATGDPSSPGWSFSQQWWEFSRSFSGTDCGWQGGSNGANTGVLRSIWPRWLGGRKKCQRKMRDSGVLPPCHHAVVLLLLAGSRVKSLCGLKQLVKYCWMAPNFQGDLDQSADFQYFYYLYLCLDGVFPLF